MYKYLPVFVCCILLFKNVSSGNELLIHDFRDTFNKCDYLIVTAQKFIDEALELARHRNRFDGDDVESARVITVEDLYTSSMLLDTAPFHAQIWSSLSWAYKNWNSSFRYLVFIGDDRIEWDYQKKTAVSSGLVPSFLSGHSIVFKGGLSPDTLFDFSDNYYVDIDKETYLDIKHVPEYKTGIALGRIPCETKTQCSVYIQKVIEYENNLTSNFGWRNSILLIADDTLHEGLRDPLGFAHTSAAETLSKSVSIKTCSQSKIYFSQYSCNTGTMISDAFREFKSKLENGVLWSVYFGHGSPGKLSDEGFIKGTDAVYLQNRNRPTIMISLSCSNGSYHVPYKNSMCKQFLFTRGGAVAYIGSTSLEYTDPNEKFVDIFFKCADSLSGCSIGTIMSAARQQCYDLYPHARLYHYHLLGDPALKPAKPSVDALKLNVNGGKLSVKSQNSLLQHGYYRIEMINTKNVRTAGRFFTQDSVLKTFEGKFNEYLNIDLPSSVETTVKINAFVWNSDVQAAKDTVINVNDSTVIAGTKNSLNKVFSVRFAGGVVHVELSQKSGKNDKLWICNMNGRLIAELSVPVERTKFSIPLSDFSLATGTYIMTIGNESRTVLLDKNL